MARRGRSKSSAVNPRSAVPSTTASSVVSSAVPSRASSPKPPMKPFRFFDLPSELRLRIYEIVLYRPEPLDLDPNNYYRIHPRLALFLVSRRTHEEAYRVFYAQPVRLFPKSGRFFHTKKPLIARLPTHYRATLNTLELLLGPGWSAPPRCQNTNPTLGLSECTSLRTLKIFVEIDPSDTFFTGFRGENATEETYKWFCVDLLRGIIDQVPSLNNVEIDAYPSVKREAPLVMALKRVIDEARLGLVWGPLRGWEKEGDEPGLIGLESAMAGMGISDNPRVVEVQA